MARKSFTLRRTTFEGGSYLQYYPSGVSASAGAASATYLRGEDIQTAPSGEVGNILNSTELFEAYAYDYGKVKINWGIRLETPSSSTPVPYSVYIVYSPFGHPETIAEGKILISTRTQSEITHTDVEGTWAYYTMFVRFLSNGADDYYEPVARLSILLPTNYGSTDALYKRVPTYYRMMDQENGSPLYKYLSVFGWDMDYIRSVLDYMIVMKDPQIAEVETLNNLAYEMGINLKASELSSERLRNLMDAVGLIRRGKGTISSIEKELSILAGAQATVDTATNTIKIYTQRCNLIKDPMLVNGVAAGIDGGYPSSSMSGVTVYDAGLAGTSSFSPTYTGGTPTDGGSNATVTTQKWVGYPNPSDGTQFILETAGADVPVIYGDSLYFSIQTGSLLKPVQDAVVSVGLYTSASSLITQDLIPVNLGSTKYWKLDVPSSFASYTNAKLRITFTSVYNSVNYNFDDFKYLLLERNFEGEYFDGNTRLGGWLVDGVNTISDYRWLDPANPNASFSVYTANYQKTKNVIKRMIPSILPATELVTSGTVYSNVIPTSNLKYTITYNNVPGL